MKITKRDVYLLISMIGVLIAVCAYQFGYLKIMERVKELAAQNQTMQSEIARLEALEQYKETYLEKTEEMSREINSLMSNFPSNVLPEDDIKLAYEMDFQGGGRYLFITGLEFSSPGLTYAANEGKSASGEGAEDAQETGGEAQPGSVLNREESLYPTYSLYARDVNLGVECSYGGLRDLVAGVYASPMRRSLESISLSYDESTGHLNGNAVMRSFYVTGMDRPYAPPSLAPVRQGTGDPFGTIEGSLTGPLEADGEEAAQ